MAYTITVNLINEELTIGQIYQNEADPHPDEDSCRERYKRAKSYDDVNDLYSLGNLLRERSDVVNKRSENVQIFGLATIEKISQKNEIWKWVVIVLSALGTVLITFSKIREYMTTIETKEIPG